MKKKNKILVIIGVFLILLSAFQNKIFAYNPVIDGARQSIADMLEDAQNNGEISQECYEELKKQAGEQLTKAEMTDALKENLFFFAVGQYANISQDIVADALLSLSDIWDYVFWDSSTQSFEFDKDIGDYIKNGLDDIIHTYPTGTTIGNWVSLPVSVVYNGTSNYYDYLYDGNEVFVCNYYVSGHLGYAMATRNSKLIYTRQSKRKSDNSNNGTPSYREDNGYSYNGTLYSGIYAYNDNSHCFSPELTAYTNMTAALADFFGNEIDSGEPILHDAVIVNENPVFPSLSPMGALNPNYKEIVINNYNNEYIYPPDRGLDINYYDYDYNYDVPFWDGHELETLSYPQEIEFPSLEFETIDVDQNVDSALEQLEGSWIIEFLLIAILLLIVGLIL